MQTTTNKKILDVIKDIYKSENLKGFYRGASVPLIGSIGYNGLLFLSYDRLRKQYSSFISGAGSGFIISFIGKLIKFFFTNILE